MSPSGSRFVHLAVREALLVALLAAAATLFINHGLLYLTGDTAPRSNRLEAYVLTTLVLYMFVRALDLVLRLRPARVQGELVLCPECGQELEDGTPKGLEEHYRAAMTPRPTEQDVLAAIALRKAVDEARRAARKGSGGRDPLVALLRTDVEDLTKPTLRNPGSEDPARRPRDAPEPRKS